MNKPEMEKEKSIGIENIKTLSSMNHNDGDISSLVQNIKNAKRRLESILAEEMNRELQAKKVVQEAKDAAAKARPQKVVPKYVEPASQAEVVIEKPKVEAAPKVTENVAPVVEPAAPKAEKPQAEVKKPVEKVEKVEKVVTPTAEVKKPAAETAPAQTESVRTKQIDNTPSYIRGKFIPKPAPVPQPPQQRTYQPRNGQNNGQNRGGYQGGNGYQGGGGYQGNRPQGGGYQGGNGYQGNRPQGGGYQGGNGYQGNRPQGGGGYQGNRPQGGYQGNGYQGANGQARPQGGYNKPKMDSAPAITQSSQRKSFDSSKKKDYQKPDDKKGMNKRTLIRKGFISENYDEDRVCNRKLVKKKKQDHSSPAAVVIGKAIITTENLTVKILSEKIGKTAQEIIKQLMLLGIMTTINGVVDFPTMELVASELGVELELKLDKTKEEILEEGHDEIDREEDLVKRWPIITVMGHVDHGKTSLLDRIRETSVATGEAGGITQHIGAYSVQLNDEKITFLDTPGHEAFSQMRQRGAQVTDIAVLVVAADDGIMPQTREAIKYAALAEVPVIVAINKIDKPGADVEKVRQMLMAENLVAEEYGGETIMVPISAKMGDGIDKLLESILLLSEVNNYRANPNRLAKGTVIEARIDKGRGPVANVIIQNGTLNVGDTIVSGIVVGKVRAMTDDKGNSVQSAGPSTPVSILGLTDVPEAGSSVLVVADEKVAKQVASERIAKIKNEQLSQGAKITLEDIMLRTGENQMKDYNIIIKGDVQGSVEALRQTLSEVRNEEVRVKVVSVGVGAINKSDIMLAEVSKSMILGFNVKADIESKIMAERAGIQIKNYSVIYDAIDDVTATIKTMITPKYNENITGRAQVRNVFKITGSGIIAGSYVTSGKIYRNSKVRVYRDGEVVFEGALHGLKRFKDDVKDVTEGYECGISVDGFSEIKENDEIEAYFLEQIN